MYRKALPALLVLVGVVFGPAVPAQAHPFGDPQTVAITADPARPDVVRVRWKVGGLDDLTLLGVKLGVLPEDRVFLDGAVFYQDSDEAAIAPSDEFAQYLLREISVRGDGEKCTGDVEPPTDLARKGVTVDFVCPAAVGRADITVRTLLDLHPAYRTLASGPGGQRAVYQAGTATHEWTFGPRKDRSRLWLSLLIPLSAAAVLLRRRIKRRGITTP